MNTFSLNFINLERISNRLRSHTTFDQTYAKFFVQSVVYLPVFNVVLSTYGEDWFRVLREISSLKNKSFYRDEPDRFVDFTITFDFGYSSLSSNEKSDFITNAKLALT